MRTLTTSILIAVLPVLSSPRASDESEPFDLAAALALANSSNPAIRASEERVEALKHVPSQVEAYPDPQASVSLTNESLTAFTLGDEEMSNLTISWLQEVPYAGKRGLAGDVARSEVDVASQGCDLARLKVRAAVKAAYAELYRIDRTSAIVDESRKLLQRFRDAARARQETGQGILENVIKADTEVTQIDVELAGLAQQRRSVVAAFNALFGRTEDAPLAPALIAPAIQAPDKATVEKQALDRSPELAMARAETRRDESRVDLAKRNLKPDFMWGAGYAYRGSLDPMVMGMFGIRLPVYKDRKQQEAVVESEHELNATRRDLDNRSVSLVAEVRNLLAQADRAAEQMRLIQDGTLPLAQSALESAAASYSAGRAEFVTVIEDFRSLLGYQKDFEMQHAEQIKALAALEPLTGTEFVVPGGASSTSGGTHE
jgi:outer membrane protein TolC